MRKSLYISLYTIIIILGINLYTHHKNPEYANKLIVKSQEKLSTLLPSSIIEHSIIYSLNSYHPKQINIDSKSRNTIWMSRFRPILAGAVGYVVVNNKYLLFTKQYRGKVNAEVLEPPAGFLNPPFNENTPHCVVEQAERDISNWSNNNQHATRSELKKQIDEYYKKAWNDFNLGKISNDYIVDNEGLLDTVKREIVEETGIDSKFFETANIQLLKHSLLSSVLINYYLIEKQVDQLPLIATNGNNEVITATWVDINDIEFSQQNGKIEAKVNGIQVKPYDNHPEILHNLISRLKTSS